MKMIKMFCKEFINRCIVPLVLVFGAFLFAMAVCSALLAVTGLI